MFTPHSKNQNMLPQSIKTFAKVFPIFFIIIFITTWGLTGGYFEQDEWLGIANVMKEYNSPWWSIFIPAQMHFSPVGVFIWSSLYKTFQLHAQYYFIAELAVHASAATLAMMLAKRLTLNNPIAIITGLLFLLNGRAHQAFTHLAIFHTTTLTMLLILLFFVFLSSIKAKIISIKKILILFLIFLTAVFTREEGLIIAPLFVVFLLCFGRNKINKKNIIPFSIFTIGVMLFISFRFFAQTLYTNPIPVEYQVTGRGAEYNMATIPVKFVAQNLIYSERIAQIFVVKTHSAYPSVDSFFTSQAPMMDAAYFYIFGILALIGGIWVWYVKPKGIGKVFVFFSSWIIVNAVMLSFVGRHISVVEPRYLYFSSFPVLCLVSIFIYTLFISASRFLVINIFAKVSAVAIFTILLITSFQEIRVVVDHMNHSGTVKRQVLENLLEVQPNLSKDTVFYITCKKECYRNGELGISNMNVLPFSSGPGMNILVMYASRQGEEKEWGEFFTREWLFHTFSEGYKKIGDRSFGYFVTKAKLEDELKNGNIDSDYIIALEYNESDYTFTDITSKFKKTLKQ